MNSLYVVEWDRARLVTMGPAMLLLDCGEGTASAWQKGGLRPSGPDAIAFTGGRTHHIAGLYALLTSMTEGGRSAPLRLLHRLDDERIGNLAAAWLQSESCSFPVSLEADHPGAVLMVGGLRCASAAKGEGLTWTIEGSGRRVCFG